LKRLKSAFGKKDLRRIDAGDIQRLITSMLSGGVKSEVGSQYVGRYEFDLERSTRAEVLGCCTPEAETGCWGGI
jgi:hypothetical protein